MWKPFSTKEVAKLSDDPRWPIVEPVKPKTAEELAEHRWFMLWEPLPAAGRRWFLEHYNPAKTGITLEQAIGLIENWKRLNDNQRNGFLTPVDSELDANVQVVAMTLKEAHYQHILSGTLVSIRHHRDRDPKFPKPLVHGGLAFRKPHQYDPRELAAWERQRGKPWQALRRQQKALTASTGVVPSIEP